MLEYIFVYRPSPSHQKIRIPHLHIKFCPRRQPLGSGTTQVILGEKYDERGNEKEHGEKEREKERKN